MLRKANIRSINRIIIVFVVGNCRLDFMSTILGITIIPYFLTTTSIIVIIPQSMFMILFFFSMSGFFSFTFSHIIFNIKFITTIIRNVKLFKLFLEFTFWNVNLFKLEGHVYRGRNIKILMGSADEKNIYWLRSLLKN